MANKLGVFSTGDCCHWSAIALCGENNMINKMTIILCLITQLLCPFAFAAETDDSIRFAICLKNIKQATIVRQVDKFIVIIQLTETATKDFETLTRQNVGKRLTILLGYLVVTSAIIQDKIDSGSIGSLPMTESDAKKLQQQINNAPEVPCGYIK